jgi:hypothetical protein
MTEETWPQVVDLMDGGTFSLPAAASWPEQVFFVLDGLRDERVNTIAGMLSVNAYVHPLCFERLTLYKQKGPTRVDGETDWFWSFDREGKWPCRREAASP